MKKFARRIRNSALVISLLLNLGVTIPALTIFYLSDGIRFYLYEQVAGRVGKTEIVFLGNSITRDGMIWGLRIGRPFFGVRNLAHSGLYTEQLEYQARIAVAEGASLAFVMAGINDQPKTPEGEEASFEAYVRVLEILREGGVEPVIQSTLYRQGEEDRDFVTGLNERLRTHAMENGLEFLDLNEVLSREKSLKSEFSRDGTHLNEAAYRVWAEQIRRHLKGRSQKPE